MQTRLSLQRHANIESSDRVVASIQPRTTSSREALSWGDEIHQQPESVPPQTGGFDFRNVDWFSHDPGPRPTPNVLRNIQAKLTVGAPNDVYEQEADRVAEQVISTPDSAVQQSIQREAMPEEEEKIQAKRSPDSGFQAGSNLENRLSNSQGGGSPLSEEVRAFMEPRFGADFSQVRVHTSNESVQMNQDLNAQAFTHGQDIYFGSGKSPGNDALTAHELTHVVQQTGAIQTKHASEQTTVQLKCSACENEEAEVQRKKEETPISRHISVIPDAMLPDRVSRWGEEGVSVSETGPNPERLTRLEDLAAQITVHTEENLKLAQELNSASFLEDSRSQLIDFLEDSRSQLIDLLEERITLLDVEIFALQERIGSNPSSSPDHPETDELGNELIRREQEHRQHQQQLRPLKRWQMRHEVGSIDDELAQLEAQRSSLNSKNDPGNLIATLLQFRQDELEQRKQKLATTLTSSAVEYEQGDKQWGGIRYGDNEACSTIKEGGCGPTSLAIVLNFLYQEDPESLAASGKFEIVTPPETAKYAETHGRICGHGTAGDPMVTNVETEWPGFQGHRIDLAKAKAQLRSGNLVIFLCKSCTGQKRNGTPKSYEGHYMVLSGIDEMGTTYNVLDPGNRESADIETISHTELEKHAKGFWVIERK
ncbi:DUF4157 domain-containing protein [Leptolyngbyaceae cyanobacterium UHCC 1019]